LQRKLLVLTYFDIFAIGGTETFIRRLLKSLSKIGWNGVVVTNAHAGNYRANHRIGNFDVRYVFPDETTALPWPPQRLRTATLFSAIRLWTRDMFRWILTLNIIFSRRIKIVYVPASSHSSLTLLPVFFPFWGLLRIFGTHVILGMRGPYFAFCSGSNLYDRLLRHIFYLEDITQQFLADKIVYVDPYLRDLYPRFLNKTLLIPNSVDTDMFHPEPESEALNMVTYVGRLSPERGIWIFLEAVELIRNEKCSFQIVGLGELEGRIRKYITENELGIFMRKAEHDEMPLIYFRSTIIVNPALLKGPWIGNITLEAMACGKCVIKSGSSEDPIVKDGFNGFVCKVGDPVDLANKIKLALKSREQRMFLGQNARRTILEKFGQQVEADSYNNLFCSLLEN